MCLNSSLAGESGEGSQLFYFLYCPSLLSGMQCSHLYYQLSTVHFTFFYNNSALRK